MVLESSSSLSPDDAASRFYLFDKEGLLRRALGDKIRDEIETSFIRQEDQWDGEVGLLDLVKEVKPTVLIGTSTHAGAFTEDVVAEMSKGTDRPIIFPVCKSAILR
jgi:malate dehydrogenase (oxaloacetate-decarboxylating)